MTATLTQPKSAERIRLEQILDMYRRELRGLSFGSPWISAVEADIARIEKELKEMEGAR